MLPMTNKAKTYIKFSDLNKDNLQFLNSYYEKDFRFFDYERKEKIKSNTLMDQKQGL